MKVYEATETIHHTTLELTREDIVKMLLDSGRIELDATVRVQITIPRGGDYSGMTLEIDRSMPLTIIAQTTKLVETDDKDET